MATKEQKARFFEVYEAAKRGGSIHPEVIAAQWAVESGWGKKPSGKNNLFGIKAGNGDPNNKEKGTVILTTEEIKGKKVKIPQKFRDYESIDESIADRIRFTQENPRYRKAGYFKANSAFEAAMSLDRAGYATDSGYGQLLIDVMKSAGFNPLEKQQYDYSTTQPQPIAQQQYIPQPTNIGDQLATTFQASKPKQDNSFADYFNQINSTLDPLQQLEPIAPKQSNRVKYQEQLAQAFGIEPQANNGLGDYVSDLVKSIYDQA